ncbi:MAG: TolC family protein [Nitrospiraceae bacterium]|nr:TolC family protein [Nitrospiraceae bacterium]
MNETVKLAILGAVLLMLLTIAVASTVYAADSLTLDQAIEQALANNPGLKAADAQVEAAQAGVLKSRSAFLPKLNLSETWSRTDSPLMVLGTKLNREIVSPSDFDPAVMNNPEPMSNYNTRLSAVQPVWNGGKEYLGSRQAGLAREAAEQDRNRTRQETVFNVIKGYYGVLLAREYRRVAVQSHETSVENLRLADARFKAGAVLQSDLLRAKVQEAEIREMKTRAESGEKLAMANLNFAMGLSQQKEFEIAGSLEVKEGSVDLGGMTTEALSLRPDLLSLNRNRKNAETSVSQAKTDFIPSLNLMGQVDWNSDRVAGDDAKSWAVMAVLQWNLFDGLVTTANVKQASAQAGRMRAMEEQMKSAVELQVKQAFYNLQASRDRIAATSSSVQEAEEGLRIVQKRYEVGMTTLVDVLGAENALVRARTNALQALYDNNVADAELKLAVGML